MSSDPHLIDPTTAHPARRYNYWLGGKDNFAADRASADEIEKAFPGIRTAAVHNRGFLHRAVHDLVKHHGVRQFLDVGTGLPTADNTHEIAQRLEPTCRIVYVDNDPLVLVHARALLTSHPHGAAGYLQADLRHPEQILTHPTLTATLDLTQPTALLLVAVLHFVPDTADALTAVRTLMDSLAPGSYLVISHATYDLLPAATTNALNGLHPASVGDFTPRPRTSVDRFFDGLTKLPPGLQIVSQWRPHPGAHQPPPHDVASYGAVARKP